MLPSQLVARLDLGDRSRREKFEEIHSAYEHLRRISQDQLCHNQKKEFRQTSHDKTDQNTRPEEPKEASRRQPKYRANPSHNTEEQTECSAFWKSFSAWKTKNQKSDDTQDLLPPSLPSRKPKVHIHLQAGSVQGPCGIQRQYPDVSIKLERGDHRPCAFSDTLKSQCSPARDLGKRFTNLERAVVPEAHNSERINKHPETHKPGPDPEYEVEKVILSNQKQDFTTNRSEERRVGKECRSRWSPYH